MQFELSDSLKNDILFAMEDQTVKYLFDLEKVCLVKECDLSRDELKDKLNPLSSAAAGLTDSEFAEDAEDLLALDQMELQDRYVKIPEWTSADGFELLEAFTDSLHAPLAREELKRTLAGGRGVFRNFKNVLKLYPDVEKRFSLFKERKMKAKITDWYNVLREAWGLESIQSIDEEAFETEYLVQNDFQFREYDSVKDKNYIEREEKNMTVEIENQFSDKFSAEMGQAVAFLWNRLSVISEAEEKLGFVCYSHSEDFIGSILFSRCPSYAKRTVLLTDFFVLPDFRGLGIGKELMSQSLSQLKKQGIRWVLITNIIVPDSMEPLLLEYGFEKLGSGFQADLFKE